MEEVIISVLFLTFCYMLYMAGYSFGRADGIKWTKDVYDGKYDDEISPPNP